VFLLVELKTATLDYGIRGFSQMDLLLVFLMMIAISMIPYALLFISLRRTEAGASLESKPSRESSAWPFGKLISWMHAHRHPELLHH
jgi:hypothetical protein